MMHQEEEDSAYEQELQELRKTEFRHAQGATYLDHAGATLYSCKQLEAHVTDLTSNLYGNPHSRNPSSNLASQCIDYVRELILQHFSTTSDCYDVVFTSGCTGALELLSESFPWVGSSSHGDTLQAGATKRGIEIAYVSEESSGDITVSDGSSVFCYLEDNHTSVVGMREVVSYRGGSIVCVSPKCIKHAKKLQNHADSIASTTSAVPPSSSVASPTLSTEGPHHLFAYPAQSNFSGCKYPLDWITNISNGDHPVVSLCHLEGSWKVLLDAASFVSTSPLDLSTYPAHFVALSFYKMFGFPTGLGALLVRRDCANLLHKNYYGGGTVLATITRKDLHIARPQLHDRLEDGTLPFLDIIALKHGFSALTRIGRSMQHISLHSFSLARYVHHEMRDMQHANGNPVCILYHDSNFKSPQTQGPIVNFNLLQPNGSYVGYSEVETLACSKDIHLRTGCFCNTGACMIHLDLTAEAIVEHYEAGHMCGDTVDLVNGRPTGSVRISFGYMSTFEDAATFVHFLRDCFVDSGSSEKVHLAANSIMEGNSEKTENLLTKGSSSKQRFEEVGEAKRDVEGRLCLGVGDVIHTHLKDGASGGTWTLDKIALYPVKSCAPLKVVSSWPVGERGFLFDREWMVVGKDARVLSQKQESTRRLCLIQPHIDFRADTLTLTAPGCDPLVLPLNSSRPELKADNADSLNTTVCGDKVEGVDCGSTAASWLEAFLGRKCQLVRQKSGSQRRGPARRARAASNEEGVLLSLANQAQYLLITQESVNALHEHESINSVVTAEDLMWQFRPNLVVSYNQSSTQYDHSAYAEEKWSKVTANGITFQVVSRCTRCPMITIEQSSGKKKSDEPLYTLWSLRGRNPEFGMYLAAIYK